MAIKISLSKKCHSKTKSIIDKNLNANANSKNPNTTFTVFNHPPDFGKEFNQLGKKANKPNGKAIADEKPNILIIGAIPPLVAASNKAVPAIGNVHEKDTTAKAKAIKKIPATPPLLAPLSTLFTQEFGNIISKAPIKEKANTTKAINIIALKVTPVENSYIALLPKRAEMAVPKSV